jgi:hypothetical protein
VAIGLAVLDELTALHAMGRWHGAVHARNVLVDTKGGVRLRTSPVRRRRPPELSEAALRSADVRAAGELLQVLLRAQPSARGSTPASASLESAADAIARSVARKKVRPGHEASQARLTLWEAAGRLASRRQQGIARRRLAELVMAELARPASRARQEPPTPRPGAPAAGVSVLALMRPRRALLGVAALLSILFFCALMATISAPGAGTRFGAPAAAIRAPVTEGADPLPGPSFRDDRQPPLQTAAVPVLTTPRIAPPSAGDIQGVSANVDGRCAPAALCTIRVEVRLRPAAYVRNVTWTARSMDACTGSSSVLASGEISAQAGWTHVIATRLVRAPESPSDLVALTESPAPAASAVVRLNGATSC